MASPNFYNENANRAYPFVADRTSSLPRDLFVDAGFVAGVLSRFDAAVDAVRLVRVSRTGSTFEVAFACDAPELFNVPLVFAFPLATTKYATLFNDTGDAGLSDSSGVSDADECRTPLWSGFVTVGDVAAFTTLLPGNGTVVFTDAVEPALVRSLAASYVTKVGLANDDRSRASPPSACGEPSVAADVPFVANTCTLGRVVFAAGYNSTVRYSVAENSITFGAEVGAGQGEPCGEIPLYAGDPGGGGPSCGDVLRSINGRGGPNVGVYGTGVTISPSPDTNTLIVDIDMRGLAVPYPMSDRSESC